MREYGTHSQPKGTWSDDSSMTLATQDSIVNNGGIHLDDIMKRFRKWKIEGEYMLHGRVFGIKRIFSVFKSCAILIARKVRAHKGGLPSIFGEANPPDERKEGDANGYIF